MLDCISRIRERVLREHRRRLNRLSPHPLVIRLISECGVDEDTIRSQWSTVYECIVYGRCGGAAPGEDRPRLHYVTGATALFWALYDVYGEEAHRIIYELLEPRLTGGDARRWSLLFHPVTPGNIGEVRALIEELCRGLDGRVAERAARYLCARTDYNPGC